MALGRGLRPAGNTKAGPFGSGLVGAVPPPHYLRGYSLEPGSGYPSQCLFSGWTVWPILLIKHWLGWNRRPENRLCRILHILTSFFGGSSGESCVPHRGTNVPKWEALDGFAGVLRGGWVVVRTCDPTLAVHRRCGPAVHEECARGPGGSRDSRPGGRRYFLSAPETKKRRGWTRSD